MIPAEILSTIINLKVKKVFFKVLSRFKKVSRSKKSKNEFLGLKNFFRSKKSKNNRQGIFVRYIGEKYEVPKKRSTKKWKK